MKLVYRITRWTNPSSPYVRHIATPEEKPLCGGNGRKPFTWEVEEGEPTCKRCIVLDVAMSELPLLGKWRYKND